MHVRFMKAKAISNVLSAPANPLMAQTSLGWSTTDQKDLSSDGASRPVEPASSSILVPKPKSIMCIGVYSVYPGTKLGIQGCVLLAGMLVHNYRSHSRLLELPSRLYYDDALVASADPTLVAAPAWDELSYPPGEEGRQEEEEEADAHFEGRPQEGEQPCLDARPEVEEDGDPGQRDKVGLAEQGEGHKEEEETEEEEENGHLEQLPVNTLFYGVRGQQVLCLDWTCYQPMALGKQTDIVAAVVTQPWLSSRSCAATNAHSNSCVLCSCKGKRNMHAWYTGRGIGCNLVIALHM